MNERIEEFYSQVGLDFENFQRVTVKKGDMEKFAELIVQECANMAESFHHHQYDFTGNLELHEFIKTHFGVEE